MSIYGNERKNKRVDNTVLKYFLDKFRDQFIKEENELRAKLRKELK